MSYGVELQPELQAVELRPAFPAWQRSASDELVNAITHGLGLVLAIIGSIAMAGSVLEQGDPWRIAGCGVYLASLVAVYAMSTLSHTVRSPTRKSLFRRLDQGAIYLLIVATYTPFSLAYLSGGWWWALLAAMWAIAIVGFVAKVFLAHRVEAVSVASYLLLGWMPIIAAPALIPSLHASTAWLMLAGGLCYTLGTVFLINDERIRHFHAIWHLLVIAGSACHFMAIYVFVA